MAPEFVDRIRGSNRNRALPGEDLGRSNLWRPMVVDRMRGSQRANFGGGLGEREANAEPPPAGPQSATPT